MSALNPSQEQTLPEVESRIRQRIAFASGLFQTDITIHTLLESLAEGVVIIDSSVNILFANSYAGEMIRYQVQDLIGRPHALIVPERLRSLHDEHVAHYFAVPKIRPMGALLDLVGCRQDEKSFRLRSP